MSRMTSERSRTLRSTTFSMLAICFGLRLVVEDDGLGVEFSAGALSSSSLRCPCTSRRRGTELLFERADDDRARPARRVL